MIEAVKAFIRVAVVVNAIVYHKAKLLGYYNVMLFLEQEERNAKHKLPSFSSTEFLGKPDIEIIEPSIDLLENIDCEADMLKSIKERFRHNGQPEDLEFC